MADDFIELKLNLTPEKAIKRLRTHPKMADVPSFLYSVTEVWGSPRDKTIVGEFKENRFVMRGKHYYSNGLLPILEGTIEPAEGGSKLTAKFRRLHSVVWLVWGIFIYLASFGSGLIAYAGSGALVASTGLIGGVALSGTALLVLFINFFARWLGDKDRPYIRDFLHTLYADARRS